MSEGRKLVLSASDAGTQACCKVPSIIITSVSTQNAKAMLILRKVSALLAQSRAVVSLWKLQRHRKHLHEKRCGGTRKFLKGAADCD